MSFFFSFINNISDLIAAPFSGLSPVGGLCLISFISAVILMFIFKWTSNQEKIKFHKDKIFGHFLEIALFRDQFRRTMACQLSILKHNLIYLRYFLFPLLIIMPPVLLVCMQLDFRLGYKPLQQHQSFIIQAKLDENIINLEEAITKLNITATDNIAIETQALHSIPESSIFWRASIIETTGDHSLQINLADTNVVTQKNLAVGNADNRFSPDKRKIKALADNLFSGETAIQPDSPLQLLKVNYQPATYPFLGWDFSPIIYYFILTLIFGFLLKPFIKVNI